MRAVHRVLVSASIVLIVCGVGCPSRTHHKATSGITAEYCPIGKDKVEVQVELSQVTKKVVVRPKDVCVYKDAPGGWVSEVEWVLLNAKDNQTLVIQGPPDVFPDREWRIGKGGKKPSGKTVAGAPVGEWSYILWVEAGGKNIGMSVDPSIIIKKLDDGLGTGPDGITTTVPDE